MTAMNTSATHTGARWLDLAQDHTATLLWTAPDIGVLARITAAMQARNAHPARTLVLLPYAQLLGQARQLWAQQRPDGFSPRFETTRSWCETLATFSPSSHDLRFDVGLDGLTARALLRQAGLAAQAEPLGPVLLETASTRPHGPPPSRRTPAKSGRALPEAPWLRGWTRNAWPGSCRSPRWRWPGLAPAPTPATCCLPRRACRNGIA